MNYIPWRLALPLLLLLGGFTTAPLAVPELAAFADEPAPPARPTAAAALFDRSNLVAWCIVPFDAKKRGPQERAEMLVRLGFTKVAYDWRSEHVASFEEEILAYRRHGLEYFAFWGEHPEAFRLFAKYDLHPQIWFMPPNPERDTQDEKVAAAAQQLLPLVEKCRELKCPLGLYNHGGWGGEPRNLVAVCRFLRERHQAEHVGIVYNFHHAHEHIGDFAESLALLQPYLLCLNLNGMNDGANPKIVTLGEGQHEATMLRAVLGSGYRGPLGILDHREQLDAEFSLRANLDGLARLKESLLPP